MINSKCKLGIIGCGKMGEAIIKGILASQILSPLKICAYDIKPDRLKFIKKLYNIVLFENISEIVCNSKYVLVAVKPQDFNNVINNIKKKFDPNFHIIISIAAGISTDLIEKKLSKDASVIRIMPNAPSILNKGISAISKGKNVKENDLLFVVKIIKSLGDYILVDEKFQNIITAISGSGPAYFFLFCKYLVDSACKRGIDKKISDKLVVRTIMGAAEMLEKYEANTDYLIEMVASPGGTTERAIEKFKEFNLSLIIDKAIDAAEKRAEELEKQFK